MSKNGLHRLYDQLDPDERFRLDVLAMARGDMQESERLVTSCPKMSYNMNDRGFGGRWHGAIELTLRIYIPLGEQLAKLQMVDAFRVFVPYEQTLTDNIAFDAYYKGHEAGSYHAWNYAGKTGPPPAWPKGEDPEEIWEPDEDERPRYGAGRGGARGDGGEVRRVLAGDTGRAGAAHGKASL